MSHFGNNFFYIQYNFLAVSYYHCNFDIVKLSEFIFCRIHFFINQFVEKYY